MKKDLVKVKIKLIELGYLDNEWLAKYLEIIEANLDTKRNRKSTQAHHAIPVNSYWTSDEPYNRAEALKLARADKINFEVHLLYKDHLIAHSYLTLCTDLDIVQLRYEAQADLRKINSAKASSVDSKAEYKIKMPKKISEEQILTKLATYDTAHQKAQEDGDEKAEHKYRCLVAQWKSRYRQYLADPEKYCPVEKPQYVKNDQYHFIAQQKRELKQQIKILHDLFNQMQINYGKQSVEAAEAKANWKASIEQYNQFCINSNLES